MSRNRFAALALVLTAVFVSSCQRSPKPAASSESSSNEPELGLRPEAKRKPAPHFALKDSSGATVDLASYKGKVVVVNFWATWCGPCKVEIPWFIEFQDKFKDRDFAVLGISMDDDGWKSVKPYIAQHKLNYRVMIGSQVLSDQYGDIDSLPTTFILDRQSRIAAMHVGLVDKRDYQDEILKLLQDPKQAANGYTSAGQLAALLHRN